jgi:hypothetical protein
LRHTIRGLSRQDGQLAKIIPFDSIFPRKATLLCGLSGLA